MFVFVFLAAALIGAAVQLFVQKEPRTRDRVLYVVARWWLGIAIGATGIFAWSGHTFQAAEVAESIGFPPDNPFQWEVAWANAAVGVIGLACFWRRDFWWPTAIAAAVYLWGAAWGHIYQAVEHNNHKANNSGPVLYADILVPLIALALIYLCDRARTGADPHRMAVR